jgi:hypothetical protein
MYKTYILIIKIMSELTPAGANAIFDRFKGILHEGECDKRV